MKKRFILSFVLMTVFLTACSTKDLNGGLGSNELKAIDFKEMVHDYSRGVYPDDFAYITATELVVEDKDKIETVYDIKNEDFLVSIAPYIDETHPCETHFLTGCQGELVNRFFDFYIEDSKGNVVLDETIKSGPNGFSDIWLPRNETYSVNVSYDGKQAQSQISTFKKDNTCITTMQLA